MLVVATVSLVVVDTIDGSNNTRVGRYATPTLLGNNPNDDFTLPGDWSQAVTQVIMLRIIHLK